MAFYLPEAVLYFLSLCFLTPKATGAFRVAKLPGYIQAVFQSGSDVGAAADAQACLDAAYNANSTLDGIVFDSGSGECGCLSNLLATYLVPSDEQRTYWVRIDQHMQMSAVTSCLTDQDARYLLMQMAYKDQMCFKPDGPGQSVSLDANTGLCVGDYNTFSEYEYNAGAIRNNTSFYLSRAQAADAVSYMCDNDQARKMIFDGTWYCYYSYDLSSSEAQGESLITGDYCSQLFGSTAHVVKISEPREYQWIESHFGSAHLGLTLRLGTTYQWYDGTVAADLPWSSENFLGEPYTLVRIDSYYTVMGTTPPITRLLCKKPATYSAYDACSKFKTCT